MSDIQSLFGISSGIVVDYTRGECAMLAFRLFALMKKHKIKCTIEDTRSDTCEYIHTVIKCKCRYIDILGIHTYDELYDNHINLYGKYKCKNLYLTKLPQPLHASESKYLDDYFGQVVTRDSKRNAELIFAHPRFVEFLNK